MLETVSFMYEPIWSFLFFFVPLAFSHIILKLLVLILPKQNYKYQVINALKISKVNFFRWFTYSVCFSLALPKLCGLGWLMTFRDSL